MKFRIEHEIRGRIRVHIAQMRMNCREADILTYYMNSLDFVSSVKVYEKSQDAVICYQGDRQRVIDTLRRFRYENAEVPEAYLENSGRELQQEYWEKLVNKVVLHMGNKLFVPYSIRTGIILLKSMKYIWNGLRTLYAGKIEVPVLDGLAIGVSVFRSDFDTASSVMFLLGIGEILEDWTHKKLVDDLARSMSLNVQKVWMVSGDKEVLVPTKQIMPGDKVVVHMGNVIPFSKGVEEKGIAIGIEREREAGTLRSIQNLMETLKLTAEQAMAALKVPDSEQEKYASMLKK